MIINTNKQLAATFMSIPLTDNVRKTYKALAMFADFKFKTFSCYPKYETLATEAGFDRSTVIKHVKKLVAIGVLRKADNYYICPRTGQRRQTSNTYYFQLDVIQRLCQDFKDGVRRVVRFVQGKVSKKVKIKSPLSCATTKQLTSKQIKRRSTEDPDPISNSKDKKLIERLISAVQFGSSKLAYKARGRRWFCNDDGGLYIHKRYVGDPRGLVGFVTGSLAHSTAIKVVEMYRDFCTGSPKDHINRDFGD